MTVYLVGAGPGDPGLLTLRAAELLADADVVVHDRLIDSAVLSLAGSHAELIDVGKRRGRHELTQPEINDLLVEQARGGKRVVRLKGGDPYVFGRGGEEALALEAAGVEYEVVPGVTSVTAAPAAAGVPLTLRGKSSSVTVVTGHDPALLDARVSLAALAAAETLVVLMGGAHAAALAQRLLDAGRSSGTPVLVVESGTTAAQRSVRTTLGELGTVEIASPATMVIGEVAALRLAAYDDRPLFGWRVVVTRAEEQSGELVRALAQRGAVPIEFATIAITDPADGGRALAESADSITSFDWVVFTSANAVSRFFSKLPDARALGHAKVAAIGSATAAALRRVGVVADLVPEPFVAEALVEHFPDPPPGGGRVLVPRASRARDVVPEGLRRQGWDVVAVAAYDTVHPSAPAELLERLDGADAVLFASSSAVTGFLEIAGAKRLPPVVACIGPIASATARDAGLRVDIEAAEHTTLGLLTALTAYAAGHERPGRRDRDGFS